MAKLLAARRRDAVQVEGVLDPANPDSDLFANGALLPGPDPSVERLQLLPPAQPLTGGRLVPRRVRGI